MAEQVVLVSGGGRGIGRAICLRFAKDGAQIIAASRTVAELTETKALVEDAGGLCRVVSADVGLSDQVQSLVDNAVKQFGRIDTLVNCAGVAPRGLMEELTPELFETILAVNIRATYLMCRAVWPVMKSASGGVIVNISSMASLDPFIGLAAYGASKAWVNIWTRGLADEGRPLGIRVFSVAPGVVDTRMLHDLFPTYPTQDRLDPADVADVVYTLAQPEWRHATGQTMFMRRQGD